VDRCGIHSGARQGIARDHPALGGRAVVDQADRPAPPAHPGCGLNRRVFFDVAGHVFAPFFPHEPVAASRATCSTASTRFAWTTSVPTTADFSTPARCRRHCLRAASRAAQLGGRGRPDRRDDASGPTRGQQVGDRRKITGHRRQLVGSKVSGHWRTFSTSSPATPGSRAQPRRRRSATTVRTCHRIEFVDEPVEGADCAPGASGDGSLTSSPARGRIRHEVMAQLANQWHARAEPCERRAL